MSISVLRWKSIRMCGRLLAPLSGITLTTRATHSLHYTLPSSSMMTRSPRLCFHWSPPRRLTALRPQALRSAHSYRTATSAHLFLRAPLASSQAKQCQLCSLKRSRSSHSLSSYSAAESRLLLPSRLSYQCPSHSWMLLCRRLHLVAPLRMCPRRRLINMSPRYLLTWQCRRLSTVSTPHLWMLPCRRSHTVLFLWTFLRRWVLSPSFLVFC